MRSVINRVFIFILGGFLLACGNTAQQTVPAVDSTRAAVAAKDSGNMAQADDYQKETTDETAVEKLKPFLRAHFAKDLPLMTADDRKFSFYAVDLNDDAKNEYFIRLQGTYFCGSGGCTFLLLDNDLKLINRFTVMRGPVFRSSLSTDSWHDLILFGRQDAGKTGYRHLKWDKKSNRYPGNPSLVSESDPAPADDDFVMWDEKSGHAKEFEF